MKIAFVYDAVYPFSKGGGERRIFEIATRLAQRGHNVHLFGMQQWEGGSTIQNNGLYYHSLGKQSIMYHPSGRRSIRQALQFGAQSLRLLRAQSFEIIDCGQWPYFHLLPARLYTWLRSSRLIVSWYEVWGKHWYDYLGPMGVVGLGVEKSFCHIPDKIIAVSQMTRSDLVSMGVRPARVEMIPNGIDYFHIRSIRAAEGRQYHIVCTGRLKNHKNVDVLLRAVAIAKRERPDISALIIGEGPEYDRLVQLLPELGLTQNVTFTGGLADFDDVLRLMKRAQIFVNASTKEGGGSITLFEANACGLPVIAVRSPHGIDPSLIRQGENGYMIDSLDPELLAREILCLMQHRDQLARSSVAAVRMAAQYDWDMIATRHENLYLRTCGQLQA